jgi:hypothetical protein
MTVATGGKSMTDGRMTIQVTEEEYEHLMRLRAELERRRAAGGKAAGGKAAGGKVDGDKVDGLPGGRRSAEFGMGAVAGLAAYWLYKELMDEDGEEDEDGDWEPVAEPVMEVRPIGVVKTDPRKRRRRGYR